MTELLIGCVSNGIRWVKGRGSRVIFALKLKGEDESEEGDGRFPHLVVAVGTTFGLLLDSAGGDGVSVVRSSGRRSDGWNTKVF